MILEHRIELQTKAGRDVIGEDFLGQDIGEQSTVVGRNKLFSVKGYKQLPHYQERISGFFYLKRALSRFLSPFAFRQKSSCYTDPYLGWG